MKKKTVFFLTVLMLTVFTSCIFSPSEDSGKEPRLVKVSFITSKAKSLSADYSQDFEVKYYLSSTALFTRSSGSIEGVVTDKLMEVGADGSFSAGYFEQGNWKFKLEAYLEDGDTVKTKIASKTISSVYISASKNKVSFKLEDEPLTGKGNITVSIKVPKLVESGASLKAYIDGTEKAFSTTPTVTNATTEGETDLIQFDGLLETVSAGNHVVKFAYFIKDDKSNDVQVNAEVISIKMLDGANILISGTMLNEKYVEGEFDVVIESDSWKMAVTPEDKEIEVSETLDLKCTLSGLGKDDTPAYQWYVDGNAISGSTSETYKFSTSAKGVFCITCIAKVNGFAKSSSVYVYVKEAQGE